MASWLASQLKAAEHLLEAVDRTVSSASVVGQQARAPGEAGTQPQSPTSGDHNSLRQQLKGPFNGTQASAPQAGTTPSGGSPVAAGHPHRFAGPALNGSPLGSTTGRFAAAGPEGAASTPLLQHVFQQPAVSSPVGASLGPPAAAYSQQLPLPAALPPAAADGQPESSSSYTLRQHGPFSPSPSPQQQKPLTVPAVETASWGQAPAAAAEPAQPAEHFASSSQGPAAAVAAAADQQSSSSINSILPQQYSAGDSAALASTGSGAALGLAVGGEGPSSSAQAVPADVQQQFASQHSSHDSSGSTGAVPLLETSDASTHHPGFSSSSQLADNLSGPVVTGIAPAAAAAEVEAWDLASSGPPSTQQQQQGATAAADHQAPAAAPTAAAAAEQPVAVQYSQQQQPSSSYGPPPPAAAPLPASTIHSSQSVSMDGEVAGSAAAVAASAAAAPAATGASAAAGSASAKELQLQKLVETLRKRLDTVKAENEQLEDMLHAAEQRSAAELQRAHAAAAEATAMQQAQDTIVASAAANAAAQDARIGRLQQELEASVRQVAALQGALEAIQEQHQQVLSGKDSIEGGALEALRAELTAAESQLDAERKAHASTKAAATSRERDLEEQLGSSSEALAATQRQMQELAGRSRDLEEQHALAAAEAARLQEQVRQLAEQHAAAQPPDPAIQLHLEAEREALSIQLAETQAALLSVTQAQHAAEANAASLQQQLLQMQHSLQAAPARGPPQLEQQVLELQELLYQKQQQLERLSGDRQAQMLMLERQVLTLKQELGKAHAAAAAANTSSSSRSGHDIIPMDALGEPYQRLARHRKLGGAVQATADFLDTTAASVTLLLRQQPLVRLAVFLYLVLIHLYVYFLLARMQRQALMLLAGQEKGAAAGAGPQGHDANALPH